MRFWLLLCAVVLASCSNRTGRIINRTVEAPSLSSNLFGISHRQSLAIYLPPSYGHSDRRFPVVYWLPNFNTPLWRYTGGAYQDFHLEKAMDRLTQKGSVREMIVVIPNATHFLGGSFFHNSPLSGNWEDFIVQDVVGYMDKNFLTIPRSNARALTGHGVGGAGALNLAVKNPDVFGSVYALSPALFDTNGLRDFGAFDENRIGRWRKLQEQWTKLDASTQRRHLQQYLQSCLNSPDREQYWDGFHLAYAAAIAADLQLPFPHIDFLVPIGAGVYDSNLVSRYELGFGGWPERLACLKKGGVALRAITIEHGRGDEYPFIRRGAEYLSALLKQMGIPHNLAIHEGGHESRLGWRLEEAMLPALSQSLSEEP